MPQNKQTKNNITDFNDFLRRNFDIKGMGAGPRKNSVVSAGKVKGETKSSARIKNSLELVVNRHLKDKSHSLKNKRAENSEHKVDIEENLILNWSGRAANFKSDFLSNVKKTANSRHKSFDKFLENLLKNPLHLWSPFYLLKGKIALTEKENLEFVDEDNWAGKLSAIACMVVVLVFTIGFISPGVVEKTASETDRLFMDPIARTIYSPEEAVKDSPLVTKEMLSNYIVNLNRSKNKIGLEDGRTIKVKAEDLQVRVAGVAEEFSEDGESLTNHHNLSKNIKEVIDNTKQMIGNSLESVASAQEKISKDLEDKFKQLLSK